MQPKINLLEAFLKGRKQTHPGLYKAAHRWKTGHNAIWRHPADYNKAAGKKYRSKVKTAVLAEYGGCCLNPACKETDPACLTIDHVFDDGAEERKKLKTGLYAMLRRWGYPKDRYQLLCHNCQWRKRAYGPDISKWPSHEYCRQGEATHTESWWD